MWKCAHFDFEFRKQRKKKKNRCGGWRETSGWCLMCLWINFVKNSLSTKFVCMYANQTSHWKICSRDEKFPPRISSIVFQYLFIFFLFFFSFHPFDAIRCYESETKFAHLAHTHELRCACIHSKEGLHSMKRMIKLSQMKWHKWTEKRLHTDDFNILF